MSPRKNSKKVEEQHPPAPFAEDDTASQGDDEFEGLSQEFIDQCLAAYHALDNLNLNDDENENGNDDSSEDSQSIPDGYEQERRGEIEFLRSNGNELPSHFRVNYRTVNHPQSPPAPLQHNAVPVAPPPTFNFREAANPAPMPFANVPQALPVWHFDRGIQAALRRYRRKHRPLDGFPEERHLRASAPGRYSRGVEGMPRDLFPHRSVPIMRRPNGRQNERMPFAPPRPLDRDMAPPMERDLLFEMWADAFVESRRMEQDMAAFRERLQRLYKFCYRS
ncbi:hypothetical protein J4E85_009524 [Alternaria conjuncta]|uniref:uncharacterized protein n=1 Tax=Alternaria conjuncta TaxID=181017 RepID=UPI00221EA906|nr:uncharacterized protein J4E85_009524 [Alternaria conjuncta]KAI4919266.1 hypothetical protein J4E85_009524 [Alternaria conjuncta]